MERSEAARRAAPPRESLTLAAGIFVCTTIAIAVTVSVLTTPRASSQKTAATEKPEQAPVSDAPGGGQHDFDFNLGTWRTHVRRLLQSSTGSSSWADYDGQSVVSTISGGLANLFELDVVGPAGHILGAGLRLYNPQSRQWNLNWTSGRDGEIQSPMYGRFVAGRGEFFAQDVVDGRNVLVRNVFSDIEADFSRFEQAFSADGGRTWQANWIMTFTRAQPAVEPGRAPTAGEPAPQPGQHDFDFAFGRWKTHIRRLKEPLNGSSDWVEYDGTHTIRQVWNGRANLGELEADGPAGRIEALSPRFFDPQTHLWRVSYGNARTGSLGAPRVGEFCNGRGEFYGQDTYEGRVVLVREIYSAVDDTTRRLEVAYSQDGGRSWQTNWIMTDTREGQVSDTLALHRVERIP